MFKSYMFMLRIEIAFAQQIPNKFGLYSLNRNFHYLSQPIGIFGFKGYTLIYFSTNAEGVRISILD